MLLGVGVSTDAASFVATVAALARRAFVVVVVVVVVVLMGGSVARAGQVINLMIVRISACPKRKRAPGLVHPVALATSPVYHLRPRPVQVSVVEGCATAKFPAC
jgi:hypothetical protein